MSKRLKFIFSNIDICNDNSGIEKYIGLKILYLRIWRKI